jgi:ADP-ribosylglycohydrolase
MQTIPEEVVSALLPPRYLDKLSGCWLGKSCGGTLGAPLEKPYGEAEPYDISWYLELPEDGIPNDDLELQLIWLKALEEVGPDLTADDLARYWLIFTGYNWDEYGLSKTNLRLGLRPPLSGYYNNWFRHSMGSPIRSEIWACVAPGHPRIAVRFAYQDAICDHAGGEGLYGELFNAAVQSAAFIHADRDTLLDIGLSYIPSDSETARAILAARDAHASGLGWLEARSAVLNSAPHYHAQHTPINLGFQTIGWLYGQDFGDALCKAVNCGYDTDCTGATLGATLGILLGRENLPSKWIEPIRDDIPTNSSWGGVRHLYRGKNPAPRTLSELTERVATAAICVMSRYWRTVDEPGAIESCFADADSGILIANSPSATQDRIGPASVRIEYGGEPAIRSGERKALAVTIRNDVEDAITVRGSVRVPEGWLAPQSFDKTLDVGESEEIWLDVVAPSGGALSNSNALTLDLNVPGWLQPKPIPIVLIGPRRFRVAGPYPCSSLNSEDALDLVCDPERAGGRGDVEDGRGRDWVQVESHGHALPLESVLKPETIVYLQGFLEARAPLSVRVGISSNCPSKLWLNDRHVATYPAQQVRPSYSGNGQPYVDLNLETGWTEVLVKVFRPPSQVDPFEGYLLFSDASDLFAGLWDVGWTRFPWD